MTYEPAIKPSPPDDKRCCICGEPFGASHQELAEMYDPKSKEGGLCHAECGLQKGWEVA